MYLHDIDQRFEQPVRIEVTEDEMRGRDEATIKMIEQIRKAAEEEEKLKTDVKQVPFTEEEVVTTSCGVPGFNLEINKVIAINAIGGNKRLPERLSIKMEDGRKHGWPVQTILSQDYKILVSIYNRIYKVHVLGRHVAVDVQQKICIIRKEKANAGDLPTRMIVPNPTNKKIHFDPFYMMEFGEAQGQMRFFRMEDNLKIASNEDLRTLQTYLDDRVEDGYRFKLAIQRKLEHNLG